MRFMIDQLEILDKLTPNNRRKIVSALDFFLSNLRRGYFGEATVTLVIEDGQLQHVRKTKVEVER